MQKSQMNVVVIGGAAIVYGGLLALLGDIDVRQMAFTGFAVVILALIPVLLINLSTKKFAAEVMACISACAVTSVNRSVRL